MEPIILPITHPTGAYDVIVGADLHHNVRKLANIKGAIVLITDSNVGPLYADAFGDVDCLITMPAGEENKTLATVNKMYAQMVAAGIDRKSTVVALGGGVVGDVAGFVAASYMRGIDFVQCPTSLLAMVDASVGGKTGVDLPEGKNLVGAFKQPTTVLADVTTLLTLSKEEFASGMAEVIKHGLLGDPDLFARLENRDWRLSNFQDDRSLIPDLQSLIAQAIQVKQDVVIEDPFEHGRRATLNLGHTFGHAIEQISGYDVRHGEGVAMGIVAATHLSHKLGECPADLQPRVEAALRKANLPTRIPAQYDPELIYDMMWRDKKKAGKILNLILIHEVGDVFIRGGVADTAVLETISALQTNP